MKGFMNYLTGALRWVIKLMFAGGLLMLTANNASAKGGRRGTAENLQAIICI